eukprot:CAMPEP_0202428612 /NCGR_PEP_ID=MMETSP1345-20130828/2573_1 /ASSEMBLY_ACC=CAM_ASM_000843 /TAXON_ID=342563 /ORGANISM="Fabrea Fabrea salina" /LENGTH=455 /DNA_ID=CAMNT_0049039631 /DNA_START=62 /DNA_END=1429 /DNA_ORIENTATION=+
MARVFVSKNPFTQQVYKNFEFASSSEVEAALTESANSFKVFSQKSFSERAQKLTALGQILREQKQELAHLMAIEMGKPLQSGISEVLKCAECCDYYAQNAENLLSDESFSLPDGKCYVKYQPLGPILSIMPFNFPFWMPFKMSIPHLMAGNTIILKHAENLPQCALKVDEITTQAGLEHEVKNLFLSIDQVKQVIADSRIKGVSLTGSVGAGKAVASLAASHMKKFVMELGGSDPFIVLQDADVQSSVSALVTARLQVTGCTCISPKRAIIAKEVYDQFESALANEVAKWSYGDPTEQETQLGPLAREDLADQLQKQIEDSVAMGARVVYGGERLGATMIQPTVLADVTPEMPAFRTEMFGPVFCLIKSENEEHAIQLANDTEYGLGASIFTGNKEKAEREIAPRIDSGMCFLNSPVKSIVEVPFGGVKNSGLGRELGGLGIKEFTNPKTVFIKN